MRRANLLSAFEIVKREREQLFTGSFIETGVSTNGTDKVGKLAIHIGNAKKLLMKIEQDTFLSRDLPFWRMDSRMVFRNSIYLGCCTWHGRVQNGTYRLGPCVYFISYLFPCTNWTLSRISISQICKKNKKLNSLWIESSFHSSSLRLKVNLKISTYSNSTDCPRNSWLF